MMMIFLIVTQEIANYKIILMLVLRPYQHNTISSLRESISKGNKRLIMCIPTGGGKTVVFSYTISKAI
jgi:superfamily II DNA or RNA helicase